MGKLKLVKLPKKPKASASITTKETYLKRVKEIQAENSKRKKDNDYSKKLSAQISGINGLSVLPKKGASGTRPKKRSKPKATKKKSARRKR